MSDLLNGSTLTCSMTRANKLLAQLRESSSSSKLRSNRRQYCSELKNSVYHRDVSVLNFNGVDVLNSQLVDIQRAFDGNLLKKKLIERWKNRLFELNIQYGIHKILGDVDCLHHEKSMLTEVLATIIDKQCINVDSLLVSMENVRSSDKKYDFRWNVSSFDKDTINTRLKEISKELSKFDELKDRLNIQNNFSIELTPDERMLLNI